MAAQLNRDGRGRFASPPQPVPPPPLPPPLPPEPPRPDPVVFPTQRHPRWRMRVFDQKGPWRASYDHAVDDALASGNAIVEDEGDGRYVYLHGYTNIQRDPPYFPRLRP